VIYQALSDNYLNLTYRGSIGFKITEVAIKKVLGKATFSLFRLSAPIPPSVYPLFKSAAVTVDFIVCFDSCHIVIVECHWCCSRVLLLNCVVAVVACCYHCIPPCDSHWLIVCKDLFAERKWNCDVWGNTYMYKMVTAIFN